MVKKISFEFNTDLHFYTYNSAVIITSQYIGTTGSKAIDYYICDPVACDPSTVDLQFTEKLIYLPPPYLIAPQAPNEPPQTTITGVKLAN